MREQKAKEILSETLINNLETVIIELGPQMAQMTDALAMTSINPDKPRHLQRHLLILSRDATQLAVSLFHSIRLG